MEAKVYNKEGQEAGKITLTKELFGLPWNADLVHQVLTSMRSNERANIADSKGRGEVRGGGKKPWRQKGTGRARHGSSRSPIWKGGGVTHGPTSERNYERKINKKMKTKALFTLLSAKLRDNEVVFMETFGFTKPQTKEAQITLNNLSKVAGFEKINYKRGRRAFVTMPKIDESTRKSFRNIQSVVVDNVINLSPLDVATYKYVIIAAPKESLEVLNRRAK
jgi:large subunit ribosomal protein L4